MSIKTQSAHITKVGDNVFSDLGFAPKDAAALEAKSKRIISQKLVTTTKITKKAQKL